MKSITIKKFTEEKPKHGDYVMWFPDSIYGSGTMRVGAVEYHWDNGDGSSIVYNDGDKEPESINGEKWLLNFHIDGMVVDQEDCYWVKTCEFFDS
jgi:hypothetical protein